MLFRAIGQLAAYDRESLSKVLGKAGEQLWVSANGLDTSLVASADAAREVKSVGNGLTFPKNLSGEEELWPAIASLCDSVAARLRKHGMKCQTVQVQIRDPAFVTIQRQKTLDAPTYLTRELTDAARQIVMQNWGLQKQIRMMTITASNLCPAEQAVSQLSLFEPGLDTKRQKREKL